MAKLERKTAKIFGETATTTGNNPEIGQFGSALAGTYNGTGDIAQIQALSAWSQGWAGAVTSDQNFPPLPEMTGVQKVNSYQNAYLLQTGIPEWDSGTTYYANTSFCQVNGAIYQSLTDDNVGNNPTTDTTNWQLYLQPANYANIDLSNLNTDLSVGSDTTPTYIKNGAFTESVGNVGSATTPTYLNRGTITASTYSIANDRFDGQWVASTKELSTATAVGTYEIDLSDYLPNDNYNYEILLNSSLSSTSTAVTHVNLVWYDANGNTITCEDIIAQKVYATQAIAYNENAITIPIYSKRSIQIIILNHAASRLYIRAYGYRRIGTNLS